MHSKALGIIAMVWTLPSFGWEATRPGPLGAPPTEGASQVQIARRTVEYPYMSGATLGDGWDFVTNTRVFNQCVVYGGEQTDGYQQARLDYTRAVDDETLSVALNINMSAEASGGFAGIGASGGFSFSADTSRTTTSKDDLIVAHASVVNGARYLVGTGGTGQAAGAGTAILGVRISDAALNIYGEKSDIEAFRAACGDGFVAAIGTGADLYLLYHFTHLDSLTRANIVTSMHAGGGVSGLFSASGSGGANLKFSDLVSQDKLGLYYVQNGGKIAALPAKLEDIADRVKLLPAEAYGNGRPLYVVVVPYSELYNWPPRTASPIVSDARISLVRYLHRIKSAFTELQVVIEDLRVNKGSESSEYLHDAMHGLRGVDYSSLNDDLLLEIKRVEQAIASIETACVRRTRQAPSSDCKEITAAKVQGLKFDDMAYLIQLPIPTNSIPGDLATLIKNKGVDVDQRKFELSMAIYRHWVERVTNERCAIFGECMDSKTRKAIYRQITSSLNMSL